MDHVVYVDAKANELENLITKKKRMIIRGATGRKLPYGRVNVDDILYFINNNSEGQVKAKGLVSSVMNSDKLSEEDSIKLVQSNQEHPNLSEKQFQKWAGKRYIVLIGVKSIEKVTPFAIDKSNYANMDDWLLVENIDLVKKKIKD